MPRGHRPVPRASMGGDGGRTGRKQVTGRGRARPGPAPLAATPPSPSLTCMTRTIVRLLPALPAPPWAQRSSFTKSIGWEPPDVPHLMSGYTKCSPSERWNITRP